MHNKHLDTQGHRPHETHSSTRKLKLSWTTRVGVGLHIHLYICLCVLLFIVFMYIHETVVCVEHSENEDADEVCARSI